MSKLISLGLGTCIVLAIFFIIVFTLITVIFIIAIKDWKETNEEIYRELRYEQERHNRSFNRDTDTF